MYMRIVQILHNKAHWIFEAEEMPNFPPDQQGNPIMLVDITDKSEVQEGWDYNPKTGELSEPFFEEVEYNEYTTLDEQIYAENLYQTALIEIQALGGNLI